MDTATLNALSSFPEQLEAHFAAIPAQFRQWAPASWEGVPSEPFTPIEQICHVRDIELAYHDRFERTLNQLNPALATVDGEALAHERAYDASSASEVFSAIRTARAKTLQLLSSLTPLQFARTATFEGYGPLTLRSLVHYLCSHDQQHLAGLQWLLGKIEASRIAENLPAV
jgi:DinB superfamily